MASGMGGCHPEIRQRGFDAIDSIRPRLLRRLQPVRQPDTDRLELPPRLTDAKHDRLIEPVLKQIYFNPDRALRLGQGFASGPDRLSEAWRLATKPIVAEHPIEKTENIWAHALRPSGLSKKNQGN